MHNAESEFSKKSYKKNGFQKYVLRQLLFTHNAELGSLFISSNNFSLCHACVSMYSTRTQRPIAYSLLVLYTAVSYILIVAISMRMASQKYFSGKQIYLGC